MTGETAKTTSAWPGRASRLLGLAALVLFAFAPWLGERSGWSCLAWTFERVRATLLVSALAIFKGTTEAERLDALTAVLEREVLLAYAVVVLAGAALVAWPRRGARVPLVAAVSALGVAVGAAVAWAVPPF